MPANGSSEPLIPRLRGVSHAVAFVLSVAAAAVAVALAPTDRARVAVAIYGVGLVALFGGSALYHRWPGPPRVRPVLRRIDHSTIFVFIAASYTPIALLVLHGPLVWLLLSIAWTGAAAGVAFSLGWIEAKRTVIAGSYLALGWLAVIAIPQTLDRLGLSPADPARGGRTAVLPRSDHLRGPAPRSMAADIRVPRGLPRLRDRRSRRALHRRRRLGTPCRGQLTPNCDVTTAPRPVPPGQGPPEGPGETCHRRRPAGEGMSVQPMSPGRTHDARAALRTGLPRRWCRSRRVVHRCCRTSTRWPSRRTSPGCGD